jgi:hypothetical protein
VTSLRERQGKLIVRGVSHDNGSIAAITVNGVTATILSENAGVVDWTVTLDAPAEGKIVAFATDETGNVERLPHEVSVTRGESVAATR